MKLFGRFLLDENLISASDLADAMIEQIKTMPNNIVILYEKKMINSKQILDIISLQNNESLDLRSACIQLGIWQHEFTNMIQEEVLKQRIPLSQILINKGLIKPQVILPVLKKYHAYCAENSNDFTLFSEIDDIENEQKNTIQKIRFEPDFSQVKINDLSEYLAFFSDEKIVSLELAILVIEGLADNTEDAEERLDSFFIEFHSLKGSARAIGAILSENLIHETEDVLSFYKRFLHKIEKNDFVLLAAANLHVLDVLGHLRNALISSGSEEGFWSNQAHKNHYLKVLSEIKSLNCKMNSRGYVIDIEDVREMF